MNGFRCGCFLAAVYMTVQQIMIYVEDNDASIVTSKVFNENPQDKYPTFTFCFVNDPNLLYSEKVHELTISRENYSNIVKGVARNTINHTKTFERIVALDYNRFRTDVKDYVSVVQYRAANLIESLSYEQQNDGDLRSKKLDLALHNSYQDPRKTCLSRISQQNLPMTSLREQDTVILKMNHFSYYTLLTSRGYLSVHIHYPGQFIRGMDKPVQKIIFPELSGRTTYLSLDVGYLSVLRKRSKSHRKCNSTLEDEDNAFKLKVIEQA